MSAPIDPLASGPRPARRVGEGRGLRARLGVVGSHGVLSVAALLAIGPTLLVIFNSFKTRADLFSNPYRPPIWFTADPELGLVNVATLDGYREVFTRAPVIQYLFNSLLVTTISLALITILGTMIAFALTEYRFKGRRLLTLFFLLGLMIPIKLGTVSLIKILSRIGLFDTLWGLVLVYTAMGLPIAVLILSTTLRTVPEDLKGAARIDGVSELGLLFRVVAPMLQGSIATILIFNVILIWNDLWFPLTLAPSEDVRTLTLGVSAFVGQYKTNWTVMLSSLTLAMLPVLALYVMFSRRIISGLMSGAVKT